MKGFKAIAVDLDGTLLRSDGSICPDGAEGLRRAEAMGRTVILATTRNPVGGAAFARDIGVGGPIICTNGTQIWGSPEGPIWLDESVDMGFTRELTEMADARGWELAITVGEVTYWKQRPGMGLGPLSRYRTVVATNVGMVTGLPIRILIHQREAMEELWEILGPGGVWKDRCKAELFTKPDGNPDSLVLTAYGCDKGSALTLVCGRLGISADEVLAVGDNHCDLAMMSAGAYLVVMANAEPRVREAGDCMAPSNDDGGVAWALNRFALGK